MYKIKEYQIEEIKSLYGDNYVIIDLRDAGAYAYGHIQNALSFPQNQIAERIEQLPADKTLVLCSKGGVASASVVESLMLKGFDVVNLAGGYQNWLLKTMKSEEVPVEDIEKSIRKKFHKVLFSRFAKAINEYDMLQEGDKVAVCISGGKDSMLMAKLFQELKRHNKFQFELEFIVMDPGYSPINRKVIEDNARHLGIPVTIFETPIFDTVYEIEKSPCYLCARMRRGYLYRKAKDLGCNKIALGHHYDDVIETILMGMLYGAQVQTMMPKLHSSNFEGMELIRPMYLIREEDVIKWRDYNHLYFIQCACRFTDSNNTQQKEESSSKRQEIKELIRDLKKKNQYVEGNIFKSVENVNLKTIIAYKQDGIKHSFLDHYNE